MKRKLKTHLWKRGSETYCGKIIDGITGSPLNRDGTVSPDRIWQDAVENVTCRTCLKASGNTQVPEGT